MRNLTQRVFALLLCLFTAGAFAACSSGGGADTGTGTGDASMMDAVIRHLPMPEDGGTSDGLTNLGGLVVTPIQLQTISVPAGAMSPTVTFTATDSAGHPLNAAWVVDRTDIARAPLTAVSNGIITPTGNVGGLVTVTVSYVGQSLTRQVQVNITTTPQNGPTAGESGQVVAPGTAQNPADLMGGGGVGGVGGEGLGTAFSNFPTTTMPPAMGLTLLYPYNNTVWPRGMLAPLLMWDWTPGDADAIQVSLSTTSGSFSWTGTFGHPAVLGTPITGNGGAGAPMPLTAPTTFTRMPIPQDVWTMATNSAGGLTSTGAVDQLTVSLIVAKGGVAYGPLTETWNVAPATLAGTLYYNSYGTHLVQNSTDNDMYGNQYGAAVLGINASATAPVVVAGVPSNLSGTGCRVCHMVSMNGSTLTVVHGDNYGTVSAYGLTNANAETVLTGDDGIFNWAGLYPDASLALGSVAEMGDSNRQPASQLYAFPPTGIPTPLAVTGIPNNFQAGIPAWSPDGKHVAFEFLGGTIGGVTGTSTGPSQLAVLDFDRTTMTFSNIRVLATMPGGGTDNGGGGLNAGLPSFFPTNDAVIFHNQLVADGAHRYDTWHGAQAQVWWSDLGTGTATVLATLNGTDPTSMTSYLPTSANHPDDTVENFEATMNPIVTGGYAWVVFTSRRLYGNLATIDPATSDPRDYNYLDYSNVTCKKLWVAAVDIGSIRNGAFMEGVMAGTDPSHPAFYLPGQELVAGNSRGFWVLPPCQPDGTSCQTGDQCCNGFCEPNASGALVCGSSSPNTCAGIQERCMTSANCCSSEALCINGLCALAGPG